MTPKIVVTRYDQPGGPVLPAPKRRRPKFDAMIDELLSMQPFPAKVKP
jgi:hypothetical protein